MPRKNKIKKPKLKYRGLGLEPDILKELELVAVKENRKINPMINILLREAIEFRQSIR